MNISTNNVTLSGAPAFTIAIGDIVQTIGGTLQTKINNVNSQTDFDVDDGGALTSGQAVLISQAVHLQELTSYGDANERVEDQFDLSSAELEEVLVTYLDSAIEKPGVVPEIAYSACSNSTVADKDNWSVVSLRPEGLAEQADPIVIPNSSNKMYIRFFANKSSGSGSVDLDDIEIYYIPRSDNPTVVQSWAAYKYDFSITSWLSPLGSGNPAVSLSGGKTRLDLGFIFDTYRAENAAKSQITVMINGQEVFKELGSVIAGDYSYTVVDSHTIDLNADITASATDDIEIVVYITDAGSVDVANIANRFTTDGVYMDDDQEAHLRKNPTTDLLEYRKDSSSPYGAIGGGGSGEAGDTLLDAESGLPYEDSQNMILDTFNTDLGTKVKLVNNGSALRFDDAETSGASYIRSRLTSAKMGSVDGKIVVDIQMMRPQATVISANTIVFDGDIAAYFTAGDHAILGRVEESDGRMIMRHLLDTDDKPAVLEVDTSTYSSVNDETTLVLLNPNTLDLNIGLTVAADVEEKLRIMPFEWILSACSDDSLTWEVMELEEGMLYDTGHISIPGEGYFSESTGITGTAFMSATVFSENKQYAVRRFVENRSSNDFFVYEFSVDKGKNWSYFGGSKVTSEIDAGTSRPNEFNGSFFGCNRSQIAVSNTGKFFECHTYAGTYDQTHGRYGDLTLPTPVLSLTPTTGSGAGIIYSSGSLHAYGQVAADKVDGSYVAVLIKASNNNVEVASFNNYGGTYLGKVVTATGIYYQAKHFLEVSGTGTAHTASWGSIATAGTDLIARRIEEGTPTAYTDEGTLTTDDSWVIDSLINDTYLIVMTTDSGFTSIRYHYKTLSTNTWTAYKTLSNFGGVDQRQGWSSASYINYNKGHHQKIVVDPTDDKHVFFVQENNLNTIDAIFYEVKDITNYEGITVNQTTDNGITNLRSVTGQTWNGQTWLTTSTKIETAVFKMYQVGQIDKGKKIWAEIYETSAGVPTTQVSGAISQEIDPSLLTTNTSGQYLKFNFPRSLSLSNATTYAVVIKGDFDISASDYLVMKNSTSSSYASGQRVQWNGSSWTTSSSIDFVFYITSHKITNIGNAVNATSASFNTQIRNFESSIKLINNTHIQFMTRRCIQAGADANHPISGHPYRKVIPFTAGGATECDTSGELVPVTLNNVFDENLVFNVSLGNPDNYKISDLVTGVPDTSQGPAFQRVGIPSDIAYDSNGAPGVADPNFESGNCINFNGSSNYYRYGQSALNGSAWLFGTRDFVIEMEIDPNTNVNKYLMSNYSNVSGTDYSWGLNLNASGYLSFYTFESGTATVANDKVEPQTYHKIRVTCKNQVVKLWRAENAGDNYTVFTEVGYSSNGADGKNFSTANYIWVGAHGSSPGSWYNGKIGYIKIAIFKQNTMDENSPFAYNNYKDQSAIVSLQNHGHLISGENVTGNTNQTISANFDVPVLSDGQESALVDSYRQLLKYKKDSFSSSGQNCNLKIEMDRGTTDDQSNVQGLLFEYKK